MVIKVVVLSGGGSPEREVSLRSGAAVAKALQDIGYEVTTLDPSNQTPNYGRPLQDADVVFPALHGVGGEDGTIQAWLEERGKRFVGSDSKTSRACFDKMHYKQQLQQAGLPVPKGEMVDATSLWESDLITQPFVLKPVDGGSSVDTFIVRDTGSINKEELNEALGRHGKMLLEELIDGQELTVATLLDEVLPVIEIIPPSGGEFDYDNKYNGKSQELCPPVSISPEIQKQAQALTKQIHDLLGIRDLSRTDFMVDGEGALWVLESNTIPGLTDESLLPKAAAVAGYGMPDVCRMLVEAALNRA